MKKIIYFIFLACSGVLVSFRGGNTSYMLFYFALLLPVLALVYSVFVYCRFRISQEVSRTVVKAVEVPYRLIMANEDMIPFLNITLHFHEEMVSMTEPKDTENETDNLCLLPRRQIQIDTKMICKYRGTYPVGVKSVSVTDFFGLFTITYPMKTQVRLTARPRLISLDKLKLSLEEQDSKHQSLSLSKLQELPDFEVRQYTPGDASKYIHWRNSAKAGALLVRKQMPEELVKTVVMMELSPIEGEMPIRLQTEDNIIEAALALVYDYYLKKIPVHIVYMEDRLKETSIDSPAAFDSLYSKCANVEFKAKKCLASLFWEYMAHSFGTHTFIMISSEISPELKRLSDDCRSAGSEIILVQTGEVPL